MGCLFLHALIAFPLKETFCAFRQQPVLMALTSVFFIYFLTGIYSDNQPCFWQRIRIVLPWLFLPFCFAKNHFISFRQKQQWLLFLFWLVASSAIYSIVILWQRHHTLLIIFTDGVYLPTVINHVRFSLMIAFAIFVGHHVYKDYRFRYPPLRYFVGAMTLFLLFFLHFTAVRSGLVGFYAGLSWLLLRHTTARRRWLSMAIIGLFGAATCSLLPSLLYEIVATFHSLKSLWSGAPIAHTSDLGRWQSIEAGLAVAKNHPFLGVGLGDMPLELKKVLLPPPDTDILFPHNQFVFFLTFSGLIGVVWFGLVWLSLLLFLMPKKNRTYCSKFC